MVHPILKYALIVWCPYTNCNIHKLEMVHQVYDKTAIHPQSVYLRSCITLTDQHLNVKIWNWLWCIKWSVAKCKLKVGTISFKPHTGTQPMIFRPQSKLILTCILITLPQLDYGMDYPAVLSHLISSTYLNILDNIYKFMWSFLYYILHMEVFVQ